MIQRTWRRIFTSRLHGQLILLVLAVVLPAFALLIVTVLEHHESALQRAEAELDQLARLAADRQDQRIHETAQLLRTLAHLPQVAECQADACRGLFAEILHDQPDLATLGIVDREANPLVIVSSGPSESPSFPDGWIERAIDSRDLVLQVLESDSEMVGPRLICGFPASGRDGEAGSVIFAAIRMEVFARPEFDRDHLEDLCIVILDSGCRVLARHPTESYRIGDPLTGAVPTLADPAERGTCREMSGDDGSSRLLRIVSIGEREDPPLFIGVGLSKRLFIEEARRAMVRNLAILAAIALVVLFAARRLALSYVLRPVEIMLNTARSLRSGDYVARTGILPGRGDLSELARSFDDLAATLQQRRAERERALGNLRESEARHAAVIDAALDGIITMDREGRIVRMNPAAEEMFRHHTEQATGRSISELIVPGSACAPAEAGPLQRDRLDLLRFDLGRFESLAIRADGMEFPVEIAVTPIQYVQDRALVTAYIRDISRQKANEEALRNLSLVDDLTGLNNRRGFALFAEQQLRIAQRTQTWVWLLFADMNGLKEINDNFGHKEGDRTLTEFAQILRETFRRSDVLARVGGDEFAILAADSPRLGAEQMIHRLLGRLRRFNEASGRAYRISISIGYAHYDPEHPSSLEELLAEGDAMMYERKRAARAAGQSSMPPLLPGKDEESVRH